jgi:hypothetical protein
MVIIALISLLLSGVSILGWGGSSAGSQPGPSASAEPITVIPQIKRTGVRTWGELVEMPDDGGRVLVGLRIENSGSRPITGLAARASLPPAITAIEGKCRYGIDQIARTTCSEAVIGDGMQLPGLQPGQCLHVVFMAGVSEDAAGGHYVARLSVTSDQTSEISKSAEVKVPATIAEEAVRGLFSGTEEERDFWNGRPEMAPRSKRLLIAQWQEFTLEHAHSFGDVPGGPSIGLSDLFYDHVYEGKVVELKVQVLGPPSAFPLKDGFVKQSVEVGVQGEHARLRCYTPRSEDHRLQDGDEVEIKAVPIAWSPPDSPGNRLEVTMAVCAAARVVDG